MPARKLIEVALPLREINAASAKEKSIRHGHPSTLHLWWARRPLAACRAVLFASLVDDPSSHPDKFPTEAAQKAERERLFDIIRALVKWENSNNERVLEWARREILRSTGNTPPPVHDPFCGGGSIPLEAQRLGLEARGSDLNPVAVLITKALIEIPPKFAGRPPVNPEERHSHQRGIWGGARGLAADVRSYGQWMRERAEQRIGHLYPKVKLPEEQGGGEATVIAWLWARTVRCPNPACGAEMPLVRSFALSTKKGREVWVEPVVEAGAKRVRFEVRSGGGKAPEGTRQRNRSRCLFCSQTVDDRALRASAVASGMGSVPIAVVAEGKRGRIYLEVERQDIPGAKVPDCSWLSQPLPDNARWFSPPGYGLTTFADLFTPRQLVALTTFSDLVQEARAQAIADGASPEYADAIATYLAMGVDRLTDRCSTICAWDSTVKGEKVRNTFARQAIPMTWDFAEANPFSDSTGNFVSGIEWITKTLTELPASPHGSVSQRDASSDALAAAVFSTDPPYYDNIGYADLSDFFYVWLRRSLGGIYPGLFSTLLVPKAPELVATPYRFGGSKEKAQEFFEEGFARAFARMRAAQHPDYPLTVYYAYKQSESDGDEGDDDEGGAVASTGWETMLEGLIRAGFQITGTWPMRSEMSNRPVANGTNALASSIVLVCRPRAEDAAVATRRDFLAALRRELPEALVKLQQGHIAPVDLQQAAIGAGGGKARLIRRDELPEEWEPARVTVWQATQYLIRTLEEKDQAAVMALRQQLGPIAETARELGYRLYTLCERNGWAQEAGVYNSLVMSWHEGAGSPLFDTAGA